MRMLLIGAVVSLGAAQEAPAQRVARHGASGARPPMMHVAPRPHVGFPRQHWGNKIGGRWHGGVRAPGGFAAYRRPVRGFFLPSYWIAPSFAISNWSGYGLAQPPYGYRWSRYYDDAVLIDRRGSVYDSVYGVDWDGYRSAGAYDHGADGYRYEDGSYDDDRYPERRDDGAGGAVAGAVVGGVAGNLIAGRGNRLGGTLIGAGVGAAAGYAIDKAEDRDRRPPPPRYGAPYAPPGGGHYPPPPYPAAPPPVVHHGPGTVVNTTGYVQGGYFYPPATVTTVTVTTQPVVTTTTEVFEDKVTYTKPHRRSWRPRTKTTKCYCR